MWVTNATAPSQHAARRVKRKASAAGCKGQRTKITSADRKTVSVSKTGAKPIPAMGAKKKSRTQVPLQDFFQAQVAHNEELNPRVTSDALQDLFSMQPAVVVGLISMMTGSALQEDIASTVGVLLRKGRDILDMKPGSETTRPTDENQTTSLSATTAHCAAPV